MDIRSAQILALGADGHLLRRLSVRRSPCLPESVPLKTMEAYDIHIPEGAGADILFSDYVTEEAGHTVCLDFHHILSRISVRGRLLKAPPAVKDVRIRSVSLTGCPSSGVWDTECNQWHEYGGSDTFTQQPAAVIEGTEPVSVADFYLPPRQDTTARLIIEWEIVHKTTGVASLSRKDTVSLAGHPWSDGGKSVDFTLSLDGRCGLIEFVDDEAKAACVANFDADGDGEISFEEAAAVTNLGTTFMNNSRIRQFVELKYFTKITFFPAYCFENCTDLVRLDIPERITYIGAGAFMGCASIRDITLPPEMTIIPRNIFNGCRSLRYQLPPNIVVIEENAFKGCLSIHEIQFPEGITAIKAGAFSGSGLITVELPSAGINLGESIFENCSQLHSAKIHELATMIPTRMFKDCPALNAFIFPESLESIGDQAFMNCSGLRELIFERGLKRIGALAFAGCSHVANITSKSSGAPATDANTFGNSTDTSSSYPYTGSAVTGVKTLRVKLVSGGYSENGWKVLVKEAGFTKKTVINI